MPGNARGQASQEEIRDLCCHPQRFRGLDGVCDDWPGEAECACLTGLKAAWLDGWTIGRQVGVTGRVGSRLVTNEREARDCWMGHRECTRTGVSEY